jgi:hypothetical protein
MLPLLVLLLAVPQNVVWHDTVSLNGHTCSLRCGPGNHSYVRVPITLRWSTSRARLNSL